MKYLEFKVNSQTLKRLDSFKPAAGSVDYLTASFTFSEDWSGTTKTAKCRKENEIYSALINSSGVCFIPHEVLAQDEEKRAFGGQEFYISVEGKNGSKTITTEEIKIELSLTSTGEAANASDPTPDIYAQYIAEVTEETKENADTAEAAAESAAASATEAAASAASLKNDFSNALKGNLSGPVIRVDDVSPVEHFPVVKVHGKNLFHSDIDKSGLLSGLSYDISKNNSAVILSGVATQENALQLPDSFSLPKGTYTVSVVNLNSSDRVYLRNQTNGEVIINHIKPTAPKTFTLTEDAEIRTYIVFKENSTYNNTNVQIQIEHGEAATEYTPYIDPATITLTSCGKNIHQCKAKTQTINGVTFTVNADGSVTANGTATKATFIGLGSLSVKVGEKYRLSGSPAGSGFDTYLLYIHNNTTGSDIYDLGEGKTFTANAGDLGLTIAVYANTTVNNLTFKPMVVYGEEIEAFEPYDGATYTPNTDGTVEGLTSISPTMTFLTDHEGITIDCEYNRDINEAFENVGSSETASPEEIKAAVTEYLDKHPIEATVTSVNGKKGDINLNAADVGAISRGELQTAVDGALQQAKESGKFDGAKGEKGDTGAKGADGYTPVKGTDYFTAADKAEIVQTVIESFGGNPVFGYVDENNNIVVKGDFVDGSYSVKYEMEDGTTVDIGELVIDSNIYYSVTNNLTNCINSNNATEAVEGESYTAVISANSGYNLSSLIVTMGGTDITASAVSGGNINIANITGDIVITAAAEVSGPAYINQIPISTDTSGNLFVGTNGEKGYKTGYRFSLTAGSEKVEAGYKVTGFIPVKYGDVVRIKNIDTTNENSTNIVCFDSNKQPINGGTTTYGTSLYNAFVTNGTESNGAYKATLNTDNHNSFASNLAFIRIGSKSITDESIVTVNQEIV